MAKNPAGIDLPVVEKALRSLPEVVSVQNIAVGDIWGERFHTTPSHELIHVLQGRAAIQFKKQTFHVGPGDTFIIPQGTEHRDIRGADADYRVQYVFFRWPTGEKLLPQIDPALILSAPPGIKPHLHLMMKELEAEFGSEDAHSADRLRLILLEILLAMLRYARRGTPPVASARQALARRKREQLAQAVKKFLEEHCADEISLEGLAENFGESPFHVSRVFSQQFGISIVEMLTLLRIDRATELLKDMTLSVKEVAAAAGFANSNYFAKVFRRSKGVSPTEYQLAAARRATKLH